MLAAALVAMGTTSVGSLFEVFLFQLVYLIEDYMMIIIIYTKKLYLARLVELPGI